MTDVVFVRTDNYLMNSLSTDRRADGTFSLPPAFCIFGAAVAGALLRLISRCFTSTETVWLIRDGEEWDK